MALLTREELKKIFVKNRKLVERDYHDLLDSVLFVGHSDDNGDSLHTHSIHGVRDLPENLDLINIELLRLNNEINNIDLVLSEPTVEKLSSQITGLNQFRFTTASQFYVGSLRVLLNGLEQIKGENFDYTTLINTNGNGYGIVMNDEMPLIPADNLTVFYIAINTLDG